MPFDVDLYSDSNLVPVDRHKACASVGTINARQSFSPPAGRKETPRRSTGELTDGAVVVAAASTPPPDKSATVSITSAYLHVAVYDEVGLGNVFRLA